MSDEYENFDDGAESDFDIDGGVADIAVGLGFDGEKDDSDNDIDIDDDINAEGDDDGEGEGKTKVASEPEPETTLKQPPQSWSKEQHETWSKLPPEAQNYIELREKQMLDGIEEYKNGHHYAQTIVQELSPYMEDFRAAGVDEINGIKSLMQHHRAITQGSLEQRQEAFLQIGIASGLIPQEGQPQIDPQVMAIRQELNQLKQMEQQRQQGFISQQKAQLNQEIQAFADAPGHEYFDDVADDMVIQLKAGVDLQTAYDRAIWANPGVREKIMQKQMDDKLNETKERKRQEAIAAKKAASTNIRGSTRVTGEKLGSWDDTMRETYRAIKNR